MVFYIVIIVININLVMRELNNVILLVLIFWSYRKISILVDFLWGLMFGDWWVWLLVFFCDSLIIK